MAFLVKVTSCGSISSSTDCQNLRIACLQILYILVYRLFYLKTELVELPEETKSIMQECKYLKYEKFFISLRALLGPMVTTVIRFKVFLKLLLESVLLHQMNIRRFVDDYLVHTLYFFSYNDIYYPRGNNDVGIISYNSFMQTNDRILYESQCLCLLQSWQPCNNKSTIKRKLCQFLVMKNNQGNLFYTS